MANHANVTDYAKKIVRLCVRGACVAVDYTGVSITNRSIALNCLRHFAYYVMLLTVRQFGKLHVYLLK